MNKFSCQIICPTGLKIEIPYYELESTCKMLVKQYWDEANNPLSSLERKKDFLNFRKDYKTFSPYFDYLFFKLGYTLVNPYLIPNSVLINEKQDGITYYFAKYLGDMSQLSKMNQAFLANPLFMVGIEENVIREKIKKDYKDLPECFINEKLEMLSLKGSLDLHNFWARMWLHPLLMRQSSVCEEYIKERMKEDFFCEDVASLLQQYYPWIRFASVMSDNETSIYFATYYKKNLSKKQWEFLKELEEQKLLLSRFKIDLGKE